jgi:hypothetical protein
MFPNFWSHSLFARFCGSVKLRGSLCIAIPMQACTQWTHSNVWSQLATTPECFFKVGGRQSEKKRRNGDRKAICNSTHGIDAGCGVICHRGVSDGSDGARLLWRSQSAQTEMCFADGGYCVAQNCRCVEESCRTWMEDRVGTIMSGNSWSYMGSNWVCCW